MKLYFFIIVGILSFSMPIDAQNNHEILLKDQLIKLKTNSILFHKFIFENENDSLILLQKKINLKLDNLQSLITAIVFIKELEITERECSLIKNRAAEIANEFKNNSMHILLLVEKEEYIFKQIIRTNNSESDYIIASEDFLKYSLKNENFKEVASILDENSR